LKIVPFERTQHPAGAKKESQDKEDRRDGLDRKAVPSLSQVGADREALLAV
jgi:hypothetical protein